MYLTALLANVYADFVFEKNPPPTMGCTNSSSYAITVA